MGIRILLPFRITLDYPRFLVEFVLLSLEFSMLSFKSVVCLFVVDWFFVCFFFHSAVSVRFRLQMFQCVLNFCIFRLSSRRLGSVEVFNFITFGGVQKKNIHVHTILKGKMFGVQNGTHGTNCDMIIYSFSMLSDILNSCPILSLE